MMTIGGAAVQQMGPTGALGGDAGNDQERGVTRLQVI